MELNARQLEKAFEGGAPVSKIAPPKERGLLATKRLPYELTLRGGAHAGMQTCDQPVHVGVGIHIELSNVCGPWTSTCERLDQPKRLAQVAVFRHVQEQLARSLEPVAAELWGD